MSLESGPTVPAPGASYVYVPGSWVWRGRYVWRPGVWVAYRPDWVWVPARYSWTPAGYVYCEGYWDYPLARRGVLFAPVAFARPVYARPAFVYTPVYVVSEPCMVGALFVRRGYGLLFVALLSVVRGSSALGLEKVTRLARLYEATEFEGDATTAHRVAGALLKALG